MGALKNLWDNFKLHLAPYTLSVYALVGTLIAFIIELSPLFQSDEYWMAYSIYGVTMLSISILFYVLVGITWTGRLEFLADESYITGIGASIFFLRLGALAFAIFGIVLWSIELFLAFASEVRPLICIIRTCLYIVFHCTQLIFVLQSAKIKFKCHRLIVYFGLTHSLVVNLWTWVSLCIAKSGLGQDEHEAHHFHFGPSNLSDTYIPLVLHPTDPPRIVNTTFERHEKKLRVVKFFGTTAITLLTGNVEFCLVSAGVLLSLFITASRNHTQTRNQEALYVGFNYDNTSLGIFLGVFMLIMTCLDIAISSILRSSNYHVQAGTVIGSFQISFYLITIITCFVTYDCLLKQVIRSPTYEVPRYRQAHFHQTTINVIFLLIGAGGEVLFCCVGLLGVLDGSSFPDSPGLALASFVVRLVEVGVQAVLLFYLLKNCNTIEPCETIGKQAITFLIALNMILFGFHTLETTVQSFGFPTKIAETHLIFLKISIPLVVFYRFHCSVCFAEVWKVFYHLQPQPLHISTAPRPPRTPTCTVVPELQTPNSARHLLTPDPPEALESRPVSLDGYEIPIGQQQQQERTRV